MTIAQLSGALALIGTIGGGAWMLDGRYAKVEQVASNSQAIMMVRIQNARERGDKARWISLCDDFRRLYGWTPGACR